MSARRGHTRLVNLVVSGEVPLAISAYLYKVAQLRACGAPIDWFTIAPVVARFEPWIKTKHGVQAIGRLS
jgi:iron(III) transport system substrate-binding protein